MQLLPLRVRRLVQRRGRCERIQSGQLIAGRAAQIGVAQIVVRAQTGQLRVELLFAKNLRVCLGRMLCELFGKEGSQDRVVRGDRDLSAENERVTGSSSGF